ncbi:MAG TPA: barstar family protein [Pseudonocardiaceae bacterium]
MVRIDAAAPATEHEFFGAIAAALDFPDYFGHNLDALNDCLGDVLEHAYGWPADAAGLVVVFTGYQAATERWPRTAWHTIDIFARQSDIAAMSGGQLLCLVQTDDPAGTSPVLLSHAEWLDSHRRVD